MYQIILPVVPIEIFKVSSKITVDPFSPERVEISKDPFKFIIANNIVSATSV